MSLSPGTRLGPYEVRSAIGAGGMGEVYRASDIRLHRDVAVKILPPAFVADPQRRERFAQEARTIAALNHPHICTLYDIGSTDATEFLVMELVEGSTLEGLGDLPRPRSIGSKRRLRAVITARRSSPTIPGSIRFAANRGFRICSVARARDVTRPRACSVTPVARRCSDSSGGRCERATFWPLNPTKPPPQRAWPTCITSTSIPVAGQCRSVLSHCSLCDSCHAAIHRARMRREAQHRDRAMRCA